MYLHGDAQVFCTSPLMSNGTQQLHGHSHCSQYDIHARLVYVPKFTLFGLGLVRSHPNIPGCGGVQ